MLPHAAALRADVLRSRPAGAERLVLIMSLLVWSCGDALLVAQCLQVTRGLLELPARSQLVLLLLMSLLRTLLVART